MAISVYDTKVFDTGTGSVPKTVTLPAGVAEDDIVVVLVAVDIRDVSGDPVIKNSGGSAYTTLFSANDENPNFKLAWKRMGATPDTAIDVETADGTTSITKEWAGIIYVLRGVDPTTTFDATGSQTSGVSANPDPPSITTSDSNSLILVGYAYDDQHTAGTVTAPTGYTNLVANDAATAGNGVSCGIASKILATPGTDNPSAFTTGASSEPWHTFTVAFKEEVVPNDSLTATDIESTSYVGSPVFGYELTANDVEATSYVGTVTYGHPLTANDIETTSYVGTPALAVTANYALTVTEIESVSYVGTPALIQASNIFLTASGIESVSYVGNPTLQDFFDFSDLGDNYSFRRTIRIHDNATTSSDRTVKA